MQTAEIERLANIHRSEFQATFFKPQKPVVLTDLARSWPAVQNWTPEFFKTKYANKSIKLVDNNFIKPGRHYMRDAATMAMAEYLDKVLVDDMDLRIFLYNIKSEMPDLVDDIHLPDLADGFSKLFIFMFFGCRHSVTQMHFDIDMSNVFHTVLHGRRTITLFPLDQSENLHRYPFTCRSYVDVHKPDFSRFPKLKHAKGYQVTLLPGETLFMPAGYWHHVRYDEAGYALSLRCTNARFIGRLKGLYNLLIMQSIDRAMNKLAPNAWFTWKEKRALGA